MNMHNGEFRADCEVCVCVCVCVCVPMMGLGGTVTLRYHVDVITDSQSLQYLYFVQPLGGRTFSCSSSVLFLLHHGSSHFTYMPASWSPSALQPHDVTDTKVMGKASARRGGGGGGGI